MENVIIVSQKTKTNHISFMFNGLRWEVIVRDIGELLTITG